MDTTTVWEHALDWVWAAVVAVITFVSGMFVKVWRHEERIKALEDHHHQKLGALGDLAKKVDENHESVSRRIDALGEDIRSDLRLIMQRCLYQTHRDDKG